MRKTTLMTQGGSRSWAADEKRAGATVNKAEEVRGLAFPSLKYRRNTLFHESVTSRQKTKAPITANAPIIISTIFPHPRNAELICVLPVFHYRKA